MNQTITINEKQSDFLENFSKYGFQTQDELITEALERLRKDLEKQSMEESAELYAEIYKNDRDLQQLTKDALMEEMSD